jgi:hypothetical protein
MSDLEREVDTEQLGRTTDLEDPVAEMFLDGVVGVENLDEAAAVGDGEVASVGEPPTFADEVDEGPHPTEHHGAGCCALEFFKGREHHRRHASECAAGDAGRGGHRPEDPVPFGQRAFVERRHPRLDARPIGRVDPVCGHRREEPLAHPEAPFVAHGREERGSGTAHRGGQ